MKDVDEVVLALQREIQGLRATLTQKEADLKMALRTRELMGKDKVPISARMSIPDSIENILRSAGALHVDDILERLREMGVSPNKQTITSALTRYHNRGKRFKRVGKNKYALLTDEQTGNENEQED